MPHGWSHLSTVKLVRSISDLYAITILTAPVWLADMDALPILDSAAGSLDANVNVAVIDYSAADWELRMKWTVTPANIPQLRLFFTDGGPPQHIPGLEKDEGPGTFKGLDTLEVRDRAWTISHTVTRALKKLKGTNKEL